MYYHAISQCTQALRNLEAWLDRAEQYAAAKKFDVGVLMTGRLAPDMKPFVYQVQSACDYAKAAAAWLSGQTPPRHEDNEQTIDELHALSGRLLRSRRACRRRSMPVRPTGRLASPLRRPAKCLAVRTTCCR